MPTTSAAAVKASLTLPQSASIKAGVGSISEAQSENLPTQTHACSAFWVVVRSFIASYWYTHLGFEVVANGKSNL
jgi:hypothetical protein